MNSPHSDEQQQTLRERFGMPPRAPRDVTSPGLTLEALRHLDEMAGQRVEVTEPGEIIHDADGRPLGVGPSITTFETLAGPVIPAEEFLRLGADPADYPNVHCFDPRNLLAHEEDPK